MKTKYTRNKFYVGSALVFKNNWGHRTLANAIKHAEQILNDEDGKNTVHRSADDEIAIVQIIRVVRRKRQPIEVEVIR